MSGFEDRYGFTEADWQACLKVLTRLKEDPLANPDNKRFAGLVGKVVKQAKKSLRQADQQTKKDADRKVLNHSTIAANALGGTTLYSSGPSPEDPGFTPINVARHCYCCNQSYDLVHGFYARLCPACAQANFRNRFRSTDLSGRNVVLTGGRVKIGYASALKFLRCKADVTVTSRFPAIASRQFEEEPDYRDWRDRLTVHGLDLRNLGEVQAFVDRYRSEHESLEILVNNAAQTIRYDADYYRPLIDQEQELLDGGTVRPDLIARSDDGGERGVEPEEQADIQPSTLVWAANRFGQPVDRRDKTSWNSKLSEIDLVELLEVNLINQISPYVLIRELTPLFQRSTFDKKFIVNVTSSEGQFSYGNKSVFHPHTNMTKASLNMLTRTSAAEYLDYGVYMNAVDVGWVSTGANEALRQRQFAESYIPPLDPVDGAARIMVPIIDELEGSSGVVGALFKNYREQAW